MNQQPTPAPIRVICRQNVNGPFALLPDSNGTHVEHYRPGVGWAAVRYKDSMAYSPPPASPPD